MTKSEVVARNTRRITESNWDRFQPYGEVEEERRTRELPVDIVVAVHGDISWVEINDEG